MNYVAQKIFKNGKPDGWILRLHYPDDSLSEYRLKNLGHDKTRDEVLKYFEDDIKQYGYRKASPRHS